MSPRLSREWRGTRRLLPLGVLAFACGGYEGVSFQRDIKPVFDERCAVCHSDGQEYPDLADPFNSKPGSVGSALGLVGSRSVRFVEHHSGPEYNLVPGQPENSFLIEKVTNRELEPDTCGSEDPCVLERTVGFFMPPAPQYLTVNQLTAINDWIRLGADPDIFRDGVKVSEQVTPVADYYEGSLLNLFGDFSNLSELPAAPCNFVGLRPGCVQCKNCHRENGPYFPQGVTAADFIDVSSTFRTDLKLVAPSNPDDSFLWKKLTAPNVASDVGSPMPHGFDPLSPEHVNLLRQWIAEGARNN